MRALDAARRGGAPGFPADRFGAADAAYYLPPFQFPARRRGIFFTRGTAPGGVSAAAWFQFPIRLLKNRKRFFNSFHRCKPEIAGTRFMDLFMIFRLFLFNSLYSK